MNDEAPRRTGRLGGIFTALVVAGSAVGVIGWHVLANRAEPAIDASGFDLSAAPQTRQAPAAASSVARTRQAPSSLSLMKGDPGVRIGETAPSSSRPSAASSAKEQARASFTEQARKHEADVRRFAVMMTKRYPAIRQYGRDWMSHPDLKKLNDDYMRNHDPISFIVGLGKAPSLGVMVKQYAGSPAIMAFITQGMKEAPGELTSSALDVLANDAVAKNLISNVARGIGLPPSITGLINSGGDASKADQKQAVSEMLKNSAPQDQSAPPVSLPDQR